MDHVKKNIRSKKRGLFMSIFTLYNCIVAAVVAWIIAGLFTEETHERAAGVLGVVCYSLRRFKAVLRAFKCLGYKCTIMTQKAVFGAYRHLKSLYKTVQPIQATPETHTHDAPTVSRCPKTETRTRPKSGKNRNISVIFNRFVTERKPGVCVIFENFRYTDRLTGVAAVYGKNFFKKYPKKISDVCVKNLKTRINFITTGEVFK